MESRARGWLDAGCATFLRATDAQNENCPVPAGCCPLGAMELIVGGGMRDSKEWEMASEKDSIVARERESRCRCIRRWPWSCRGERDGDGDGGCAELKRAAGRINLVWEEDPRVCADKMRSSPAICKADVLQKILDGLEHRHTWDCGVCGVGNCSSVHSPLSSIFHMCFLHCNFYLLKSPCQRHEIHEISCLFEIISTQ